MRIENIIHASYQWYTRCISPYQWYTRCILLVFHNDEITIKKIPTKNYYTIFSKCPLTISSTDVLSPSIIPYLLTVHNILNIFARAAKPNYNLPVIVMLMAYEYIVYYQRFIWIVFLDTGITNVIRVNNYNNNHRTINNISINKALKPK